MRALVLDDLEVGPTLQEIDLGDLRDNEVRVRIAASGVCGSDLHVLHGQAAHAKLPVILGHEAAGLVDAVGSRVRGLAVGERVVVMMFAGCGQCRQCAAGTPIACEHPEGGVRIEGRRPDGSTTAHRAGEDVTAYTGVGSMAEYTVVPAANVLPVPDDVPLELAALAGCGLSTGLGAVFNVAGVQPGATVCVIGCGGVGLSIVQAARISGAARIVAVDPSPLRRRTAEACGATTVLDASAADLEAAVLDALSGGADVVFEAVGKSSLVAQALTWCRPGGQAVMVGVPDGETIPIPSRSIFANRLLRGTMGGSIVPARDIRRLFALVDSGALDLEVLVDARFPLEAAVEALRASEAGEVTRALLVNDLGADNSSGGPT